MKRLIPRSIMLFICTSLLVGGVFSSQSALAAHVDQNPYISRCSTTPVLRLGSTGYCVKRVQWYLRQANATNTSNLDCFQIAVDGIFGPKTRNAVELYQGRFALRVDGVVGPITWSSLRANRWKNTPEPC
jgi:peptidoglycan hydrolase-like protein with peptidoglycan-binding domain